MIRPRFYFRPYSFAGVYLRKSGAVMNEIVLTRKDAREVDRRAIEDWGVNSLVLMENAGRGTADKLLELEVDGPVAVLCGKGNNGGDGFVLARHLKIRGYEVRVLLACPPDELAGDAAANFKLLEHCRVPVLVLNPERVIGQTTEFLREADWAVDALLGTGATGRPRAPYDQILDVVNETDVQRLALDIPSGVDCDSGEHADVAFLADHTITYVAPKQGLLDHRSRGFVGRLHVVDIGIPTSLAQEIVNQRVA